MVPPGFRSEILCVQFLPVKRFNFVIGVDDVGDIAIELCRVRGNHQRAGDAGGQRSNSVEEFGAMHDRARLVHVNRVGGQRRVPDLAIPVGDGVE